MDQYIWILIFFLQVNKNSLLMVLGVNSTSSDNIPVPCPVHTVPSPCEHVPGKPAPELCIASADICDQMQDCNREAMISDGRIGRDELGCNRDDNCDNSDFESPCRTQEQCVSNSNICDGKFDCLDGSDEAYCNTNNLCPSGYVASPCPSFTNTACVPVQYICNYTGECPNGEDELLCSSYNTSCGKDYISCRTTPEQCIPAVLVCNNHTDCYDNSDELFCGQELNLLGCPEGYVLSPCPDEMKCIDYRLLCNLAWDCSNGLDESVSIYSCPETLLQPFGRGIGDNLGPFGTEKASKAIQTPSPITFYNQSENTFYISTSGLISFRNSFTSEDVDPFPLSESIIAPFWANLNVNPLFGGAIFYNVVENDSLLTTFNNEVIRFNSEFQGFRAKYAVTITWHNVALYDSGNPPIMFTFQLLLATDNNTHLAAIIHHNITLIDATLKRIIGFNAGNQRNFDTVLELNTRSRITQNGNIFRIDGECVTYFDAQSVCPPGTVSRRCESAPLVATDCECENSMLNYDSMSRTCRVMCHRGQVQSPCPSHIPDCIESNQICNSQPNCPNREDEILCQNMGGPRCDRDQLPCRSMTQCIPLPNLCNGIRDCSDNSDEIFCGQELSPGQCPTGYVPSPCPRNFADCMDERLICDLAWDCAQGEDELNSTDMNCHNTSLFPFGRGLGDDVGPSGDNDVFGSIPFSVMYYGSQETSLFISTNGLITFRGRFMSSNPRHFPIAHLIIAPLWADLVVESNIGTVYYSRTNDRLLSLIGQTVANSSKDFTNYLPTSAIIVTWNNARIADNGLEHLVSFQLAIATDGMTAIAIFIYDNYTLLDFTLRRTVGFNKGDVLTSNTVVAPGMVNSGHVQDVNIYRIDGLCVTDVTRDKSCPTDSLVDSCIGESLNASKCSCRNSFLFFNTSSRSCESINFCESNPCHFAATCINTNMSYMCTCNISGFAGDGITECSDINECQSGAALCDQICVNTNGSYYCSCNEGYQLDNNSHLCTDVDECSFSPCHTFADCFNTKGSFQCTCRPVLYQGDGFNCQVANAIIGTSVTTPVIVITLGLLAFVMGCCFLRLRRKVKLNRLRSNLGASPLELEGTANENEYFQNMRNMMVNNADVQLLPKTLIIPSCNLQIGNTLGQGEFGIVYKGLLKKGFTESFTETVAVKTLKGFLQEDLIQDLLNECAKMMEMDHPNVLTLTGVCLDGGPAPYIILPFMANGSLLSYLKKERDSLILNAFTEDTNIQSKLLDICIQVAKGMEYLSSKRVIHRDLAARNCMIDANFVIKVSDFGLSESIDSSKDYFRQNFDNVIKLPVKWLSPESINDGIFSEKTDVWAFGVTCWEIYSGGKSPYPGIHPLELSRQLETGYRMEKPLNAACTEDVYVIVLRCWDNNPERRPNFTQLVGLFSRLLSSMADYLDVFTFINQSAVYDLPSPRQNSPTDMDGSSLVSAHDNEDSLISAHDKKDSLISAHDKKDSLISAHDKKGSLIFGHDDEGSLLSMEDNEMISCSRVADSCSLITTSKLFNDPFNVLCSLRLDDSFCADEMDWSAGKNDEDTVLTMTAMKLGSWSCDDNKTTAL